MTPRDVKRTSPVVTTEEGLVITDEKADALEARVVGAFRKPFYLIGGLIVLIFVILLGLSVFLSRLSDTVDSMKTNVNNTDQIVTAVAGPEARKAQAEQTTKFLDTFSAKLDCTQQNNLQRLVDELAHKGFDQFKDVSVIKEPCKRA